MKPESLVTDKLRRIVCLCKSRKKFQLSGAILREIQAHCLEDGTDSGTTFIRSLGAIVLACLGVNSVALCRNKNGEAYAVQFHASIGNEAKF